MVEVAARRMRRRKGKRTRMDGISGNSTGGGCGADLHHLLNLDQQVV